MTILPLGRDKLVKEKNETHLSLPAPRPIPLSMVHGGCALPIPRDGRRRIRRDGYLPLQELAPLPLPRRPPRLSFPWSTTVAPFPCRATAVRDFPNRRKAAAATPHPHAVHRPPIHARQRRPNPRRGPRINQLVRVASEPHKNQPRCLISTLYVRVIVGVGSIPQYLGPSKAVTPYI